MKEKGITLVSLVVTIIILIILAGTSLNLILGEEGIITIAKRARENIEISQEEENRKLNELYKQLQKEEGTTGEIEYDIIAKLNNFKKEIADYIEEAGGIKPEYTADTQTFRESINQIVKEVTKDATATEEDITQGKTAWINGEKVVGTGKKTTQMNIGTINMRAYGFVDINVEEYHTFSCTYGHSILYSSTCDATIQIVGIDHQNNSTYIVNRQRATTTTISNVDISNYKTIRILSIGSNYQDTINVTNIIMN